MSLPKLINKVGKWIPTAPEDLERKEEAVKREEERKKRQEKEKDEKEVEKQTLQHKKKKRDVVRYGPLKNLPLLGAYNSLKNPISLHRKHRREDISLKRKVTKEEIELQWKHEEEVKRLDIELKEECEDLCSKIQWKNDILAGIAQGDPLDNKYNKQLVPTFLPFAFIRIFIFFCSIKQCIDCYAISIQTRNN